MNALEKAIEHAILEKGENKAANKAYLEFIKANFIIPIEKNSASNEPEVLYLTDNDKTFLPVFSSQKYLDNWCAQISDKINILKLSGVDFLKGVGDEIIVALNPGSEIYKEFNPAEITRMRSMIMKIFKDD